MFFLKNSVKLCTKIKKSLVTIYLSFILNYINCLESFRIYKNDTIFQQKYGCILEIIILSLNSHSGSKTRTLKNGAKSIKHIILNTELPKINISK